MTALAIPITTQSQAVSVATISAEDPNLGELVAKTLHQVGEDGIVSVVESKNSLTAVEHQTGMQFDQGYLHPFFVTNPERMEATLEHPALLVTDSPITTFSPLNPLHEECHAKQIPLVIIAPDIGGDALPTLLQNKVEGKLQVLGVRAPSFGQNQKDILADIALLTGATFVSSDTGITLEDINLDDLGRCESVTSTKLATTITDGGGDVTERIASLKTQLKNETSSFEQEKLKERLAKLTNGVSVIRVGGYTEIEMKERKERVIDAVAALKAAMKTGIVPGGETIYLKTLLQLPSSLILSEALTRPFAKLLENAGLNPGQYMERLQNMEGKIDHAGVNVITGDVVDMVKEGIIDPVAVPLHALENAVSVAIQIITTGTMIIPFNEYKVDIAKMIG